MTGVPSSSVARRRARAALVAPTTSGAVLIVLWVMAVALIGPGELAAPVGFGLFGPPAAYLLVRPTIVISIGVGALVGIVFFREPPSPSAAVHSRPLPPNATSAD